YRNRELRKHQFFVYTEWPGGYYGSPSIPGSRAGGVIAAAWGGLKRLGKDGYIRFAEITMSTARALMDGVNDIDGLHVIGKPDATIFSFGAEGLDAFAIGDAMERFGWTLDRQLEPPSLHLVVTPAHVPVVENFLEDLKKSVEEVRANPASSNQGMAAMYGMMAKIPEQAKVDEFILQFLDDLYKA
ncbi:unnamed protein product, partial [marine sediment metagenome]